MMSSNDDAGGGKPFQLKTGDERREATEYAKNVILDVARALVDLPEQVTIDIVYGEDTGVLKLAVAKTDLGKVIGKQGGNVFAMRTILKALSAKCRIRAVLDIVEEDRVTLVKPMGKL